MDDEDNHYCVDIGGNVAYDVEYTPQFGVLQAIALHSKMWPQFSTVTISFMGGSPYQHKIVRDVVNREFVPLVNLNIEFVEDNGDMRISYLKGQGAWSALGTDARLVNRNKATMNLGWLDDQPGGEYAVVKHELGHGLGAFLHEHTHPAAGFTWNEEVVVNALQKEPNNWDRKTIQHNMFDRYNREEIRSTEYDIDSIMHYFFPETWTNEGVNLKANKFLSAQDKYFLQLEYPRKLNMPRSLIDLSTPPSVLYGKTNHRKVTRTQTPAKNKATIDSSSSDSSNTGQWVIGVVLVLALIGLALWAMRRTKHNDNLTPFASQSSTLSES